MPEPTLLIVDDVDDIRAEMIEMFDLVGFAAKGAGSIEPALDLLRGHSGIRIVLCDLRLRGECGADLGSRVREDPALSARALDFLFLTGDPAMADLVDPQLGKVLLKPVDPGLLIRTVEALVGKAPPG